MQNTDEKISVCEGCTGDMCWSMILVAASAALNDPDLQFGTICSSIRSCPARPAPGLGEKKAGTIQEGTSVTS